jgi:hypothetical protein
VVHREEVQALAERTPARAWTYQARRHETEARRFRGAIVASGEPSAWAHAATHDRQALVLAEELGMRPLQAHWHRGLGMLYATIGQREQARAALATPIATYQSMAMTFWLPETEAALAQVDA